MRVGIAGTGGIGLAYAAWLSHRGHGVIVFAISPIRALAVEGRDACKVLNRVSAANVDVEPGRIVYTQWLNDRGGIEADVTVTDDSGSREAVLKVNDPLTVGGSSMYLLGNGFAPVITVRDAQGAVVFSQPVVFLSQDANLTSVGVVKVPDGLSEQLGMKGFFYPTATELDSGALTSSNPNPDLPTVTFNVYTGDLGLDAGVPSNVFELNTDTMTQIAGNHTDIKVILGLGDRVELPGGLGSLEFTELKRFIGVDIRHDPTQLGVGLSTALAIVGLLISFSTRRRRVWVIATPTKSGATLRWGAMSRSEDPRLVASVDRLIEAAAARVR